MGAVGRLTDSVAHDFNNRLMVIRSSVDLLKRKGRSEERRSHYVAAIPDNREVGDFTRDALAELGYQTVLASSTEVVMPGTGGIELAQHVRRNHCNLPIVRTSGYSHVLA